jgi:hypothetical protein
MATITSAASGNFSAGATWVGGVVPGVNDDAVAATGHIVDINVDVTCISINQAGTGRFRIGNGITLTANVTINAGTRASFGTLQCTATTFSRVIGAVSGASSTVALQVGIFMSGSGQLIIDGNVTGTPGVVTAANAGAAIYTDVLSCTITINGNVSASTAHAADSAKYTILENNAASSVVINITGNVTGSNRTLSHAIVSAGNNAQINVTGIVSAGSDNSTYSIFSSGVSTVISVIGAVWGGSGTAYGVYSTGNSAIITVSGQVLGGYGGSSYGVFSQGTSAQITISGTITGGSGATAFGLYSSGVSAIVNITANITGGSGVGSTGVRVDGASAQINLTGNVTSSANGEGIRALGASSLLTMTGIATAVNFQVAVASQATTAGTGIKFSGNIIDSPGGRTALITSFLRMVNNSGVTQYANDFNFPNGGYVSRVAPSNVTGMPAAANVRSQLTYGFNNELTGTLAVPSASLVLNGIATDNTTGTYTTTPSAIVSELFSQIAAGVDPIAERLKNVATVQTTGAQMASYNV